VRRAAHGHRPVSGDRHSGANRTTPKPRPFIPLRLAGTLSGRRGRVPASPPYPSGFVGRLKGGYSLGPVRLRVMLLASVFGIAPSVEPTAAQTGPRAPATYPALPSEIPAKFTPTHHGFDHVKRDLMIPMRDGVRLHTVILIPKGAGRAPILLTRTPSSLRAILLFRGIAPWSHEPPSLVRIVPRTNLSATPHQPEHRPGAAGTRDRYQAL
jgi:hypothetical protein